MAEFMVETKIKVACQGCGESLDVEWFEDDGRLEVATCSTCSTCSTCVEGHVPDMECGECGEALDVAAGEGGTVQVSPCPKCTNESYNKGHADAENKE